VGGKKTNKRILQKKLGLIQDPQAPIFFWPSRLDPVQKGCQLLSEILYKVISRYSEQNLEIVFVADGEFQRHFNDIVRFHNLSNRVAVCSFNERLARLAYGGSDFVLMPSSFEPCGLPQMIGAIYGALPVAHDTGGIHDTVAHLDLDNHTGNGFLFNTFDSQGLSWAIDQAMQFHMLPVKQKQKQVKRIMMQGAANFNHKVTAQHYIDLYEKMLQRPLVNRQYTKPYGVNNNSGRKAHNEQEISRSKTHGISSDRADQQNIINFSKKKRRIEEQQSKLLRANEYSGH
jgi:starch synthase/alpha-amylase